jgi:hypothetical protein
VCGIIGTPTGGNGNIAVSSVTVNGFNFYAVPSGFTFYYIATGT